MKNSYILLVFILIQFRVFSQDVTITDQTFIDILTTTNCVDNNDDGIGDVTVDTNTEV